MARPAPMAETTPSPIRPSPRRDRWRDTTLPLTLLIGDAVVTFAGLSLGYFLRYETAVGRIGLDVPDASFARYLPLLLVGVALLVAAFVQFGLYDTRLLLRRYQNLNAILKGASVWLVAYLGLSLVLKFDPPISRLFVLLAFAAVVVLLYTWRSLIYALLTRTPVLSRLRRRAVILGWNDEARSLANEIARDPAHPFSLAGIVTRADTTPPFAAPAEPAGRRHALHDNGSEHAPWLGTSEQLAEVLANAGADLLIITRLDLPRDELQRIVETCERAYVEWKIVPSTFDIFLSGLRLQTIGRVPVLGVEALPITRFFNRGLKRLLDLAGACVGLALSLPVMAVLAALIKRESPGGPVFFRQTRIGAGHRPFTLHKLRSMAPDAAAADAANPSTRHGDPRLLRIGAVMRRWNLDELPQFWNVLRGEMSLVGPRPERPYHVDRLSAEIPHYLPRHLVKPGMTGWAQVNGLRGDTSIERRIQHDIYYIENWNLWLDLQILALTFVRWKGNV
ncbi:MAG TPA: sugar transferase [Opitutaceae bacterium]